MTRIDGPTCAYRPQLREFQSPRAFAFGGGTNLFEVSFQRAPNTLIRRERGFLVLLMFAENARGTIAVWEHHKPWDFRILGEASIGINSNLALLKVSARFQPFADVGVAEGAIARDDYVRYLSGPVEDRIVMPTAQGGAFILNGIPIAEQMKWQNEADLPLDKMRRIWACGTCREALWHFHSEGGFGAALRGGLLEVLGTPRMDVPRITDQVLRTFQVGRLLQEGRVRYQEHLRGKFGHMVPDARWLEAQTALIGGDRFGPRPFRVGAEEMGLCSESPPSDQFRFLGLIDAPSIPGELRLRLEGAFGKQPRYPVFEDLTHPGFRYFRLA